MDGTEFEYPDQAGYPDGMGTLHEGTEETEDTEEAAEATADDVEGFAMADEEDDEGV